MLPWRLEEIKFGSKYPTWITVSVASHLAVFLLALIIGHLSFVSFHKKILEVIKTEAIDIELITAAEIEAKTTPQISTEQAVSFVQSVEEIEKALPLPIETSKTVSHNKKVAKSHSEELKRYEQLLSKHFAMIFTRLPSDLKLPDKVFLWIKIDRHGAIYDFGFKPKLVDPQATEFLNSAVSASTPVPSPPTTEVTADFMQYLIPMNFR